MKIAPRKLPPPPLKIATCENCPLLKYPPMKVPHMKFPFSERSLPPFKIASKKSTPQKIKLKKIVPYESPNPLLTAPRPHK